MGSIIIGTAIGVVVWWCDGGRTSKKASECVRWLPIDNGKAIKVYPGQWKKEGYLQIERN